MRYRDGRHIDKIGSFCQYVVMPTPADTKRESILAAAQVQFSRYGFRRTSMEDIAKETGISRASLYSYFDNKEEIFRSLSVALQDDALNSAERILQDTAGAASLKERIENALLAYVGRLHEIIAESPHSNELMDESSRLCGEIALASSKRFEEMLAAALDVGVEAGDINLKSAGLTPATAAELIRLATYGFKQGVEGSEVFRSRLQKFVMVFFSGLGV